MKRRYDTEVDRLRARALHVASKERDEARRERDEARRERDEALSRVAAEAGKDLAGWAADLDAAEAAHARVVAERDEARAEVERLRERVSTQEDGLSFGEQVCARLVVERDEARHSCRMLRQYLVEVMPWVGVCPLDPDAIHDMALARDLASNVLAGLSQCDGHPSDSTR